MTIRRLTRALAATTTAGLLAIGTLAGHAAMSPGQDSTARAKLAEMSAWVNANPSTTPEQFTQKYPVNIIFDSILYGMLRDDSGYCIAAANGDAVRGLASTPPGPIDVQDVLFYDSVFNEVFVPDLSPEREAGACMKAIRASEFGQYVPAPIEPTPTPTPTTPAPTTPAPTTPTPTPTAPTPTPQPPTPTPSVNAAVVTGMKKDVKKAGKLIKKAQKGARKAKPTLKQLKKLGLKPSAGTKVAVKYAKTGAHCVRATNSTAGLAASEAVWYDSKTRKVTVGLRPSGKKSACGALF